MRKYAKIHLTITDDADWRALSRNAQHLYLNLLYSQTINNAGVADWRPVRMSAVANGWNADDVELDGKELEAARFIEIDHTTEEVLVRSFIRNDEILNGPTTAQGMANAFKRVVSLTLRATICREVNRVRQDYPESGAWKVADAVEIADKGASETAIPGDSATSRTASDTPSDTPSDEGLRKLSASYPLHQTSTNQTSTSETSNGGASKLAAPPAPKPPRGHRLPGDFAVTPEMHTWAMQTTPGVDIELATLAFCNYWSSETGANAAKLDWTKTWQNWLLKDFKQVPPALRRASSNQNYQRKPGERRAIY